MKKKGLIFFLSAVLILSLQTSGAAVLDDFSVSGVDFIQDSGQSDVMIASEIETLPESVEFSAELTEASGGSADFGAEEAGDYEIGVAGDFSDTEVYTNPEKMTVSHKVSSYVNPMYQDVLPQGKPLEEQDFAGALGLAEAEELVYFTDPDKAAAVLREKMIAREQQIVIGYKSKEDVSSVISTLIYDKAIAYTGDPLAGDYIGFQTIDWNSFISYFSDETGYQYSITFSINYMTTAAQEAEVTNAVDRLIRELDLSQKTDYAKVKAIYDYVCGNVVYDDANLDNESYLLKYTAYAALINKTAVCQGYSNLLYRLLLEAGINNRIVSGYGNGGAHAWNIVCLDGKYYSVDATWDAVVGEPYQYFLEGSGFYQDHELDEEFVSGDFAIAYPISPTSYDSSSASLEDPDTPSPAPEDPDTPSPAPEDPETPSPVPEDPDTPSPAPEDPETPSPAPEDPDIPAEAIKTEAISGIPAKAALKKGAKLTLKPVLVPADSTESVTYKSSNTKIATVSSDGIVKGISKGTAVITVTSGSISAETVITVPKTVTKKISGVKSSIVLKKGRKYTLNPKLTPADSDEKITYKSLNKKVAAISSKGVITARKKGTAIIVVTSGKKTVKCTVKVK